MDDTNSLTLLPTHTNGWHKQFDIASCTHQWTTQTVWHCFLHTLMDDTNSLTLLPAHTNGRHKQFDIVSCTHQWMTQTVWHCFLHTLMDDTVWHCFLHTPMDDTNSLTLLPAHTNGRHSLTLLPAHTNGRHKEFDIASCTHQWTIQLNTALEFIIVGMVSSGNLPKLTLPLLSASKRRNASFDVASVVHSNPSRNRNSLSEMSLQVWIHVISTWQGIQHTSHVCACD